MGIALGAGFECVWTHEGAAACQGRNNAGQLGHGFVSAPCSAAFATWSDHTQEIVATQRGLCARDETDAAYCTAYAKAGDAPPKYPAWQVTCELVEGRIECTGGPATWWDASEQTQRALTTVPPEVAEWDDVALVAWAPRHASQGPDGLLGCAVRASGEVACWDGYGDGVDLGALLELDRWSASAEAACGAIDHDADGVVDGDLCPDEPEVFNGVDDGDGCPDEPEALVAVDREYGRLVLSQKIVFEYDKSTIRAESFPVLDATAAWLHAHPGLMIEVQGHSPPIEEYYGRRPTQDRAESVVEYLVHQGVDPARLVAKGYGETMPIATNETDEGRARNQRIELVIVDLAP